MYRKEFLYITKLFYCLISEAKIIKQDLQKYFKNVIINLNHDDFGPQKDPFKVTIAEESTFSILQNPATPKFLGV